ncbi:signal transduction histidine kinase [Bradyrhizobium japonicum]|uniref:ATP-binding protein n=1 Tax=Bradyrhizobium elkanii TaxID=29448 RepID=UPI000362CBCE|nr:ATP-binding protein [Bradyrhizobium elkanii]MCP1731883.1 signal transduction histidine kinase [Bradyrhizobium elkanii]MCS3567217.1 signal transduction histidine kinase [Bradyrhizobium elkanii]MCS3591297.1 signal transduction histidine kinase [Bradyrhizobium elkanii]MCS3620741.1 signal transduction histidine kinase [Bradyrhizobium elkanii]MCW2111087.1 signal transduction histidine kinase [Bradyrhizobium elkanii]
MGWAQRLIPRSVAAQLMSLVALSELIGIMLAAVTIIYLFDSPSITDTQKFLAGRVAELTQLVRSIKTPADADELLAAARRGGLDVRRVALGELVPRTTAETRSFSMRAFRQLAAEPGIELMEDLRHPAGSSSQLIVRLDEGHALMADVAVKGGLWSTLLRPVAGGAIILLISMLLLSVYAVRWVIAPLAEVARAATSFGRSPRTSKVLRRRGPREIAQVADALNDMRTRIAALLDDRTRMLAAISHDLRTPLTRLRLRSERVREDALRTAMLGDIAKMTRMINETLEYLREDARTEAASCIDLPSFLQTICSDFADTGHAVSYAGPARLPYVCRPRALSRAVTNVVENAVKHGSLVAVTLRRAEADHIEIAVADDGPGIPPALRDKVFKPFFKADSARQDSGGFGLGLSIAQDIVKRHGGSIALKPGEPSGLLVSMLLPPTPVLA